MPAFKSVCIPHGALRIVFGDKTESIRLDAQVHVFRDDFGGDIIRMLLHKFGGETEDGVRRVTVMTRIRRVVSDDFQDGAVRQHDTVSEGAGGAQFVDFDGQLACVAARFRVVMLETVDFLHDGERYEELRLRKVMNCLWIE